MLSLNQLRDNKGSKRMAKALGRGIGSGKGKTSGRGGKGQTARSGVAVKHNEGGQMPLFRRLPKRGFKNYTRVEYDVLNLSCLQALVDKGVISPNQEINKGVLKSYGLCSGRKPVKVLGTGEIKVPLNLIVDKVSETAQTAIIAQGGSVRAS